MKLYMFLLLALVAQFSASLQTIEGSTLTWETSNGNVPSGAFSINNKYSGRIDYVCKYECSSGFFNPGLGSFCHYPLAGAERRGSPFQILVNKDNFEKLEWKSDSWGKVPENSVATCLGGDVYVGKNKYGLGKVHTINEAFFLPWSGDEHWYKNYEVLTISKDFSHEEMYNVRYNTDVEPTEHFLEIMRGSSITNNECRPVQKTVELSRKYKEEKRWDVSNITTSLTNITASIPILGSSAISLSIEKTQQFSRGTTVVESNTYSVSTQQTIPPNHSCRIKMLGRRYQATIPFTATLKRYYRDGTTKETSITGNFNGVNMGKVHTIVEPCRPLPTASPCT